MKKTITLLFLAFSFLTFGQEKVFTKTGMIKFESDAPMEKIEAINRRVVSIIDTKSGAIEFSVLIRSFEFKKALMQEHFNEEYMESPKFPKATFKGKITNLSEVNFAKDGKYKANVKGEMTIHGVTQSVNSQASIEIKNGKISASSNFTVKLVDYDIKVPSMVSEKIAEVVAVSVRINEYEPYKK